MPIELYFGNRLEHLSEKLSELLFAEDPSLETVFDAPVVIVPNQNLAKWLQLTLVGRESIVMNVDFQYLEDGLWHMLEGLDPSDKKPERLDSGILKILLLNVLQQCEPSVSEMQPIITYLYGTDQSPVTNQASRIWQLTEKLTHLFQEYEFHRSAMIDRWNAEESGSSAMEVCQRIVYGKVSERLNDYARNTGKTIMAMRHYAETVLGDPPLAPHDSDEKPVIHLFGLSQISEFHLHVIGRLSPYYTIAIYALNPSREFWEDIKTPGEKKWVKRLHARNLKLQPEEIEQGDLFGDVDQALLSAWGKPGRESVRLLCSLTEYDFNACYSPEVPAEGLLQIIQNNILNLSDQKAEHQDRSLQITACPSVYREVETVYNSIVFNLDQNKNLQLTDIAVLVPDMATYKPVFDSVFNRRPKVLSYNLVDSNARMESAYAQGVLGILALARGRFSRKEVFDLMMNPCFMHRWGIDTDQVRVWASWVDKLGVFHAFDRHDKARRGYARTDLYTWKQGLTRLRLGRLMTLPEAGGREGQFKHFKGFVPFGDIHTGDRDQMDTFCLVVETLYQTVSQLTSGPKEGVQWSDIIFNLFDRLLDIPEALKGEITVKRSLIQAFECLSVYDRLNPGQQRVPFDLDLLTEFISSHLESISGGVGDYLTSGVTISALQPMRPIPFPLVYILGMGEGQFPGRAETSSLDLRLSGRRIGDITTPERNSYLFLEILLAVREKLYISYVARDLQKDRSIQPCSVVNQLRRYVEQELLPEGQSFVITQVPLKGSSVRYTDEQEITPASDVMVNYAVADRIACLRSGGHWDRFVHHASSHDRTVAERFFPDLSFTGQNKDEIRIPTRHITIRQLAKFLENPVHQSVRYHLGMYDEDDTIEDLVLREDEPFFSEFPVDYRLKTEPVVLWVEARCTGTPWGQEEIDVLFDRVYDSYSRKSQVPEGAFSLPDRTELKDGVLKSCTELDPIVERMNAAPERYRAVIIGEQGPEIFQTTPHLGVKRFGPVCLTIPESEGTDLSCEVDISGALPWFWREEDGQWHVLVLTGSTSVTKHPNKYALAPVLFCMLCLTGQESAPWFGTSMVTLHVLFKDKVQKWAYDLDADVSRRYITGLVTEYLAHSVSPWLPFEAVQNELPTNMDKFDDHDFVQTFNSNMDEAYAEASDPMTLLVKPARFADAFDAAEKRLGPFLPQIAEIREFLDRTSGQNTEGSGS